MSQEEKGEREMSEKAGLVDKNQHVQITAS